MKNDLIYKIGGAYLYADNPLPVDDNPIGVQFIYNGKLYLSKDKLSFLDKKDFKNNFYQKMYDIEVIENPHEYFFFRVDEYMDENQPGYGWGENGYPKDERWCWKPTGITIKPTKDDIGYTKDNPRIKSNSPESKRFKNATYHKYTYTKFWNETKSGINLTEYKTIIFIGDEYYYKWVGKCAPLGGIQKSSGKCEDFVRDHYIDKMIGNRKKSFREQRLNKIL